MESINIFISYSHQDEDFKVKLEKHLTLLKRQKIINTWNDRKIVAGQDWDQKIKDELNNAHIILLLISIDFLNSDYCYDVEIEKALEKHEKKEAVVIPIVLRKCDWTSTSFSKIQALPKDAKPIKSYVDEDEAFFEVIDGLKKSIEELKKVKEEKNKTIKTNDEKSIEEKSTEILHRLSLVCDSPPNYLHWVGRKNEINDIENDDYKVVFISGIGGQGKSGLASYYIKEKINISNNWEYWDWRDCQEKENRIHTKIISIICRLTNGKIAPKHIIDATIDELINLFFNELKERKIVFVFDNVDAYVEFENFHLTGAVKLLYNAALKREHNSKFIFTCRTSINDIDTQLLIIKLEGLSELETLDMFIDYNLPFSKDKIEQLASNSFQITKGHPLWLNLIAGQAKRGLNIVNEFIIGISNNSDFEEDSLSSILSTKILSTIWDSLNDKQKTLLMAFAAIVKAETKINLSKILDSELNFNQFDKSFKNLKLLNLIVTKTNTENVETYELHPLVKEYIIRNFAKAEMSKYISLFVNFYDNLILILKPKLNANQPLTFFENWTAKVELEINNDRYKNALISLEEVSSSLCDAGYVEEYIRVANILFINIDWEQAITEEYSYFDSQFTKFCDTLTNFGKFGESFAYIKKYEKKIIGKGIDYIRLCNVKSHYYWFNGDFEKAIEIASEAVELEEQNATKSGLDSKHNLALALRDTKDLKNIEKALEIFKMGKPLEDYLNIKDEFLSGSIIGNVGRCLQFMGDIDNAILCYNNSLNNLEELMNKGYGYFWLGECFQTKSNIEESLCFYMLSKNVWQKISPIKCKMVEKRINKILKIDTKYEKIIERDFEEIEKLCNKILSPKTIKKHPNH